MLVAAAFASAYDIVILRRGAIAVALSYEASVLLMSFAMFGFWCFFKEFWAWVVQPHLFKTPQVSFLIVVKDLEQEVEEMLRHLMLEIEIADIDCDVVVVDCDSEDLTYLIVERLSKEFHELTAVHSNGIQAPVGGALAYCRGGIVHVLDTIHRIDPAHFVSVVCWLLKETRHKCSANRT